MENNKKRNKKVRSPIAISIVSLCFLVASILAGVFNVIIKPIQLVLAFFGLLAFLGLGWIFIAAPLYFIAVLPGPLPVIGLVFVFIFWGIILLLLLLPVIICELTPAIFAIVSTVLSVIGLAKCIMIFRKVELIRLRKKAEIATILGAISIVGSVIVLAITAAVILILIGLMLFFIISSLVA